MDSVADPTRWIVSQRPAKAPVEAWRPNGFFLEPELSSRGEVLSSACILLTNKECPWRCLMCDLWKHTLSQTVPAGAIPAQIDYALKRLGVGPQQVKLYNSGSFFDPAAIPPDEYPAIVERVGFAQNIVVEAHPRLIGEKALRLRDLLSGSLEVAMGLETVHPGVLPRLNKRFSLDQFAEAASFLRRAGIAVRAFVLVQPPFMGAQEAIEWAVRSARFAFECGAGAVSLIPTRPGNGALDELMKSGQFAPPDLLTLELAFEECLELRAGRVFADTWELEQFSSCRVCFEARQERLQRANLAQAMIPRIRCASCSVEVVAS